MKRLGYISVIFNLANATVLSCLCCIHMCMRSVVFCVCVVCIRIHVCCIFVL